MSFGLYRQLIASIIEMVGRKKVEFQLKNGKATAKLEIPARRTVALEIK